MDTIKIEEIKTNDYYLYKRLDIFNYPYTHIIYDVNGNEIKLENTYSVNWFKSIIQISSIKKKTKEQYTNCRYELIDKALKDKFKELYKKDEVCYYSGDLDNYVNELESSGIIGLYEFKQDILPESYENIPIQIIRLLDIDIDITKYSNLTYDIITGNFGGNKEKLTVRDIQYQELDRIIFPDIILPLRPCKLTSKQTYDIIRNHIKTYIDGRYAKITSDYDFCFDVEKNIQLTVPEPYQIDIGKRKPKYETRFRTHRIVKLFEMTYSPENYKGYTPIQPFQANNVEELDKLIKDYLEDLITKINEPLHDCPHCKGTGVIIK